MKRIRLLRKKMGLTGEELGKLVGVQKSAISKYERGEIQPSIEVITQIAFHLNTSVDYLFERTDDPTPPNAQKQKSPAAITAEDVKRIAEEVAGRPLTQEELIVLKTRVADLQAVIDQLAKKDE